MNARSVCVTCDIQNPNKEKVRGESKHCDARGTRLFLVLIKTITAELPYNLIIMDPDRHATFRSTVRFCKIFLSAFCMPRPAFHNRGLVSITMNEVEKGRHKTRLHINLWIVLFGLNWKQGGRLMIRRAGRAAPSFFYAG